MSKYTQQTEITKCDIPGCNTTNETAVLFETVTIDGRQWDICRPCYKTARPIIVFLADVVGLDLRLEPKEKDATADETLRY